MKKIVKIFLVMGTLAGISGYFIWQKNKHKIVKDLLVNSVSNFSDSLYSLHYDSSLVNELNGEAYFDNIVIKTDSLQLQRLKLANNMPDILLNVTVRSITAMGLDIPLAMNEKKLFAKKIILNEPCITIIHTGAKTFKKEDNIALFRKILGDYNSIHAETIEVINAKFINKNLDETVNIQLTKLNILFNDIIVDSTKDYKNVMSYFINNMKANTEQLYINKPDEKGAIVFDKITYDAFAKIILIDKISTLREGKSEERFVLNSVKLEDLNVKDFVDENTINVGNISTGECTLTLFLNKKDSGKTDLASRKNFDFPDDYFDKIIIGGISIGKSTLIFRNRTDPDKAPIRINGFVFQLSKNMKINERSTLRAILDNAKWDMQADDFTIESKDNKYTIFLNGLKVDKASSSAFIRSLKVKPLESEEVMASQSTYQQDIYNIEMKSIQLKGLDINKFMNESALHIQEMALTIDLKVYHDRAPMEHPESKVGKYPHQLLLNMELPVYIKKAIIKNSIAGYRERSKETKQVGNILFTSIEGVVSNITNNTLLIQQNPICELKGSGLLLGKAKCTTEWCLFLNSENGKFEMDGKIGSMNFRDFNPLTKPLGLTTIEGQLNSLEFKMAGNDNETHGDILMLYSNLKLESYKLNETTQIFESKKTKGIVSNLFVKNNNHSNGSTRFAKFSVRRDSHKSFFNLVWKGVYDGIQNTILNKKVAGLKKQMTGSK